jgi:hypothetical protein
MRDDVLGQHGRNMQHQSQSQIPPLEQGYTQAISVIFTHQDHSLIHETGQNNPSSPSISVKKIPKGSP